MTPAASPALLAAAWHVAVLLLVLTLPVHYRDRWPVWASTPEVIIQAVAGGIGYLLAAIIAAGPSRDVLRVLVRVGFGVIVGFGVVIAIGLLLPSLPMSQHLLMVSAAVSAVTLAAWGLGRTSARVAAGLGVVAALVLVVLAGRRVSAGEDFTVDTQFYLLSVRVHRTPELGRDLAVEGGGLTRLGTGMLHVTGAGRFSRVALARDGALTVTPLSLTSPANVAEFAAQAGEGANAEWFRVVDLLAESRGDSVRVLVSHHHWDAAGKCFSLRVSEATAPVSLETWSAWRTAFDARPCLPVKRGARGLPFQGSASGGRMVRVAEGVLLTVGDHQFDGLNAAENLPQDTTSDYGKVVLLRPDGTSQHHSIGHRNPQGLAQDAQGRIWETEHGPRGGDELNLIERGANYGWPYRTFGTEYAVRAWPALKPAAAAFREPRFAFVPSPGISNLLAPRSPRFADWSSSLLVGTLKVRELLRVQLDGDRPVYVEEIRLQFELRDLEEAEDGTLVAWTDQGALLTIRPSDDERSGAALALGCAGCHTMNEGQRGALGPNLHRVVGREVASTPDYGYSEALRAHGGRWTRERLDAFLADPQAAVPGTTMAFPGIKDPVDRRNLIEYLAGMGARR